jgi:hypothetical protein
MTSTLEDAAQSVFRWALGIFSITVIIGILNGIDVWEPSHKMLLTHVHAGTLGWITLAVIGVSLLMFGEGVSDATARAGSRMAMAAVAAVVLYVAAFATTTGLLRPIAGTLMLVAIIWALVWVARQWKGSSKTVAGLGLYLALISLTIGAVLGVLLGIFLAQGSLPGLSAETAGNLAGAHPPAMLIGYLILAGAAVAEYFLGKPGVRVADSKSGMAMVWILFIAGMLANVGFIGASDPLIQAASMLQVVGVVLFIVRMRRHLKPSAWRDGGTMIYGRLSVVFLAVGIGLLVYIVQLFVSGQIDPEAGEGAHILLAFDHVMFIGVMTNALLLALAGSRVFDGTQRAIVWATNLGLIGFVVGLLAESDVLKRVSTPVMGAGLLLAIFVFIRGGAGEPSAG